MPELPRGTVAFLFTDIEGSTRLWRDFPDAMPAAYARHDTIVRTAVDEHGGVVYKVIGDAFQIAFPTAPAALAAALAVQRALTAEPWAASGLPGPLRVRTALHAGAVNPDADGDYRSPVLNRLGRLLGVGHGGQVLLSAAAQELVRELLPEGAKLRDLGERRLKDLEEPSRIYQLDALGLRADFPPLTTLGFHPHNLPVQPTSFLGRERAIVAVVELLRRGEARLVTLTGPGGTGKTRLSLQVAGEVLEDFADGVWFVELAPIGDAGLVLSAVAQALGLREDGSRPLQVVLHDYLRSKRLLLVLDNFEHVLPAATAVGELLAASPGLAVLASSRAPLHLRGEREYAVAPLAAPDPRRAESPQALTQYDAVRLFIARAQDVKTGFAVDDDNAPAVAEICFRLDGLPLAIELAAARVKLLPPEALLRRLDQRLPVLTGGARDAPERQRTLRAAIAWSHDLLALEERTLFRRLAVFAGGFTLEAAETVANGPGDLDVFAGVEALLDHSLIRQSDADDGDARFMMLETIREFAREQLGASEDAAPVSAAHAAFFLTLAEEAEPHLRGMRQAAWLGRLRIEHPNLREALRWHRDRPDLPAALRLAGALGRFWEAHGHIAEGWSVLDGLLAAARADPSLPPGLVAKALSWAGTLAWVQSDFAAARDLHQAALERYTEAGDERGIAFSTNCIGVQLLRQGDECAAEALFADALRRYREIGDAWGTAFVLVNTALFPQDRGELAEAEALMTEALGLFRAAGDPTGIAYALMNVASVVHDRGDYARAQPPIEEAIARLREIGDGFYLAYALLVLGYTLRAQGEHRAAILRFVEALQRAHTVSDRWGYAQCFEGLTPSLVALGEPELAVQLLAAAAALRDALGAPPETTSLSSTNRAATERALADAREMLGETRFAAIWAAAARRPVDAVVAEAIAAIPIAVADAAGSDSTELQAPR